MTKDASSPRLLVWVARLESLGIICQSVDVKCDASNELVGNIFVGMDTVVLGNRAGCL
jgi:hypothetical protein